MNEEDKQDKPVIDTFAAARDAMEFAIKGLEMIQQAELFSPDIRDGIIAQIDAVGDYLLERAREMDDLQKLNEAGDTATFNARFYAITQSISPEELTNRISANPEFERLWEQYLANYGINPRVREVDAVREFSIRFRDTEYSSIMASELTAFPFAASKDRQERMNWRSLEELRRVRAKALRSFKSARGGRRDSYKRRKR